MGGANSASGLKAQVHAGQPKNVKSKTKKDPVWRRDKVHGTDLKSGTSDPSGGQDLKIQNHPDAAT
jgi:hypothetical protein